MKPSNTQRVLGTLALGLVTTGLIAITVSCGPTGAPGVDECSNLREVQANAGGSIKGRYDFRFDDFEFEADGSGDYSVVPPDASDCAQDIAARLEGACRICREGSDAACETTVQGVLDQPTQACKACGDDLCQPGETPANCPQDCSDACGNGTCEGTESFQTCPADCSQSGCGDGTCAPGENPTNCAQDCGAACGNTMCEAGETPDNCPADCDVGRCGDGRCNAGETSVSCREDCGAGCGNGVCDDDESGVLCPEDCGGCTPNAAVCQGNVLIVCNSDAMTTTSRPCGADANCREGACRATDPAQGQADVEAQMLGFWTVDLDLQSDLGPAGTARYTLEVFEVSEPNGTFGVWPWKGAIKADNLCLADNAGGACVDLGSATLGRCSGATCDSTGVEVAAKGTFNSVTNELIIERSQGPTEGDMFVFDPANGYVAIDVYVHGAGTVVNDAVPAVACPDSYCTWSTRTADGTVFDEAFPDYNGTGWSISLDKISEN